MFLGKENASNNPKKQHQPLLFLFYVCQTTTHDEALYAIGADVYEEALQRIGEVSPLADELADAVEGESLTWEAALRLRQRLRASRSPTKEETFRKRKAEDRRRVRNKFFPRKARRNKKLNVS